MEIMRYVLNNIISNIAHATQSHVFNIPVFIHSYIYSALQLPCRKMLHNFTVVGYLLVSLG